MNIHAETLTYNQAKSEIIKHVKAWIMPYEPTNSEEFRDFFTLIPVLMNNPTADLDELCASVID